MFITFIYFLFNWHVYTTEKSMLQSISAPLLETGGVLEVLGCSLSVGTQECLRMPVFLGYCWRNAQGRTVAPRIFYGQQYESSLTHAIPKFYPDIVSEYSSGCQSHDWEHDSN